MGAPKTLQAAIVYFANPDNCLNYLAAERWPDGVVVCPTCGAKDVPFVEARKLWQCKNKHARKQFSIKVGTIMEDSPMPLDKWLLAMWMVTNCKNGISSYEIHRAIGVTQKSAWFMLHRIRLAMQTEGGMFDGEVEVDETYIGGKSRNMHADVRAKKITAPGVHGKVVVFGMLERNAEKGKSKVRAMVVDDADAKTLQGEIRNFVEAGSAIYSDESRAYRSLVSSDDYTHAFVRHAEYYVDGVVHTNGIENFWNLLKRSVKGTLCRDRTLPHLPLH